MEVWAILAGNLEQLNQIEADSEFGPWVVGSKAWLQAQNRQPELALQSAQSAVALAEGASRAPTEALVSALEGGEALGAYDTWLRQFVRAVLIV